MERNNQNDVFIGARALKDDIKYILPTFDIIINQIEQMRIVSQNDLSHERKEFNNTLAIFGGRGTGKTSAIYTILEHLEEQNRSEVSKKDKEYNIILPLIEPDNFGPNTKIMGSIIGFLSDYVDNLLIEIKSKSDKKNPEFFKNCIYNETNQLKQKKDQLLEYHLYAENEYRQLLLNTYQDIATHIKKSSYLLTSDVKLKEKFIGLIDEIVKYHRSMSRQPMIFIVIDDIDLKTTKCRELIDSLLQYSNHPNLVTILSGDYDILRESVMISLIGDEHLHEIGLHPGFMVNHSQSISDRKRELSEEYLKKMIPPSRRHSVVSWNIDNIHKFSFGGKSLGELLDELLEDDNIFSYKTSTGKTNLKYSYLIFDKTPRGLINSYYNIHQITSNLKILEDNDARFKHIKGLIDTIVNSSKDLIEHKDELYGNFIIWGNSERSTYIDYTWMKDEINPDTYTAKDNVLVDIQRYFKFYCVGFILVSFLKGVKHDRVVSNKVKNMLMYYLLRSPSDIENGREAARDNSQLTSNTYNNLFRILFFFMRKMSFSEQLFFMSLLNNSQDASIFINTIDNRFEFKENNKNILKSMKTYLLERNNIELLKNYRIEQVEDQKDELSEMFNFLNNVSRAPANHNLMQQVYEYDKQNDKEVIDVLTSYVTKNTLYFVTILTKDELKPYIDEMTASGDNTYIKRYKALKTLNSNIKKNGVDSYNRQIRIWNRNCKVVIEDFLKRVDIDYETWPIDSELLNNSVKSYIENNRGGHRTLFEKAKQTLKDFINLEGYEQTIHAFLKSYSKINDLANNNRAWYGVSESYRLLSVINDQLRLHLNIFQDMVPLLYEINTFKRLTDPTIKEDLEYETIKKDMVEILDRVYEDAFNQVKNEYAELDMELEDDESVEIDMETESAN